MIKREFFPKVKKTIMRRQAKRREVDVLGSQGIAWAKDAVIYGPNWYHNIEEDLIEIYDAGPALVFRDLLPRKDKYKQEGLYLQISIAYRTTENACANIRTFSGNHVTLPNSIKGEMFVDPNLYHWVTDDLTINVNSVYSGERLWIQRVEWEWVSKEVVFDDELVKKGPYLMRAPEDIEAIYTEKKITPESVKAFLLERIDNDEHFAKRCLALMNADRLLQQDMVSLYNELGIE